MWLTLWFHLLRWRYLFNTWMVNSAFSLINLYWHTWIRLHVLSHCFSSLCKFQVTHHEYEVETTHGRTITKRRKTKSTVMFDVCKIEFLTALLAVTTWFQYVCYWTAGLPMCMMSLTSIVYCFMKGFINAKEEKDTKGEDSQRDYRGMSNSFTCCLFTCDLTRFQSIEITTCCYLSMRMFREA